MAIYIEYEGINGDVTADGYKNHIMISSLAFGVARAISMNVGNLGNREPTRPSFGRITLKKIVDSSVTSLFKESVSGATGKKVMIKFVRTGAGQVMEFMRYNVENCLVSGYTIKANGENIPEEIITLSFSKIIVSYIDHDDTNKYGNRYISGYDLVMAKPV